MKSSKPSRFKISLTADIISASTTIELDPIASTSH